MYNYPQATSISQWEFYFILIRKFIKPLKYFISKKLLLGDLIIFPFGERVSCFLVNFVNSQLCSKRSQTQCNCSSLSLSLSLSLLLFFCRRIVERSRRISRFCNQSRRCNFFLSRDIFFFIPLQFSVDLQMQLTVEEEERGRRRRRRRTRTRI